MAFTKKITGTLEEALEVWGLKETSTFSKRQSFQKNKRRIQ